MIITDIIISIIEIAVVLVILYFILERYNRKKIKKLLENYDDGENKSRRNGIGNTRVKEAEPIVTGLPEPSEQELLPTTKVSNDRENNDSSGNNSKGISRIRKLFKR
jgi:hypothetical protein